MSAITSEPSPSMTARNNQLLGHEGLPIACTEQVDEALLTPLLEALRGEPCTHTWQPLLAARPRHRVFETFLQILAHGRPGRVFTYYQPTPQGPAAVAVGVVSDKIAKSFPHDGMPVLGRAFVRADMRGQRLYSLVLRHRLAYCQAHWDSSLSAIHLGTSSGPIEHCFRRHHQGTVIYLGDETLQGQGKVRALLGLTPTFERGLLQSTVHLPAEQQTLVRSFLRQGAGNRRVRDITAALGRLSELDKGWSALNELLQHIPTLH